MLFFKLAFTFHTIKVIVPKKSNTKQDELLRLRKALEQEATSLVFPHCKYLGRSLDSV